MTGKAGARVRNGRILLFAVLVALPLGAQAPDPIADRLRFEIAIAQRDVVAARAPFELALNNLRTLTEKAAAACAASRQTYDPDKFACVAAPAPAKTPAEMKEDAAAKLKASCEAVKKIVSADGTLCVDRPK